MTTKTASRNSVPTDKGMAELERKSGEAAGLLKLLANENRLLVLCRLAMAGELSVTALVEAVDLSQSALSQHLAKLRSLDLVETRRDRQMIYYSCNSDAVRKLLHTLDGIFGDA